MAVKIGFIYDLESFELIDSFQYEKSLKAGAYVMMVI